MEEKTLHKREADHNTEMTVETEPQPFLNTIQHYWWLKIPNLHDTLRNILLLFFTALIRSEKLTIFHQELEMTNRFLLSGELYWNLLSVFMQAAEDLGSLLSLLAIHTCLSCQWKWLKSSCQFRFLSADDNKSDDNFLNKQSWNKGALSGTS